MFPCTACCFSHCFSLHMSSIDLFFWLKSKFSSYWDTYFMQLWYHGTATHLRWLANWEIHHPSGPHGTIQRVAAWIVCIPCGSEGPPDFPPQKKMRNFVDIVTGSGARVFVGKNHGHFEEDHFFSWKSSKLCETANPASREKTVNQRGADGKRMLDICYQWDWGWVLSKTQIWNSDRLVKKTTGTSNHGSCMNLRGDSLASYFKSNPTVKPNPLLKSHLLVSGDTHHLGCIKEWNRR